MGMRIEEENVFKVGLLTDLHVGEACVSRALELDEDEALIDDGEGSRQRQDALQLLQPAGVIHPSVGRSQHKEGYKWSSTV
jgi:hypothetical protein